MTGNRQKKQICVLALDSVERLTPYKGWVFPEAPTPPPRGWGDQNLKTHRLLLPTLGCRVQFGSEHVHSVQIWMG